MEQYRKDEEEKPGGIRNFLRGPNFWIALIGLALLIGFIVANQEHDTSSIEYSDFLKYLDGKQRVLADGDKQAIEPIVDEDGNPLSTNILSLKINEQKNIAKGRFVVPPKSPPVLNEGKLDKPKVENLKNNFSVSLPSARNESAQLEFAKLREKHDLFVEYVEIDNSLNILWMIMFLLPVAFILMLWISYRRSQNQMMGGGGFLSGFSRSPAKRYEQSDKPTTFDDVAGLEGVKADLAEIVDYLRDPEKFRRLGGRVPKGVLLNGPPGTGKTLLAKAVAGEANVPFFSVNGSEFIQMFVGVGASRVRDLFKQAKDNGPAIIFIDEIDAVGRQRGAGLGGGHDEREQTLNQILSEMDGFEGMDTVIVIAATNRPDVLDPALLRPGRFDRHVTVDRPTLKGRHAIFKVHVKDVVLAADVDLETLAAGTVGMTGADIRNLVNEAALWAARNDKKKVEMDDFEFARDKIQMGAKREEVLTEKEKEKTAYHEAGHALTAWNLPGSYPVHKVTVVPRGRALGVTQMVPDEDRLNFSESEIRDHLVTLLGGRAAEKLIYDEFSVGAENDLDRATSMARRMVTRWGMSQKLGPVSYKMSEEDPFLGREMHQQRQFSEHTMEMIDAEVTRILQDAAKTALDMLREKQDDLEAITRALVEKEIIDRNDIEELIGPGVHVAKKFVSFDSKKDDSDADDGSKNSSESNGDESSGAGSNGSADGDSNGKESADSTSKGQGK